MYSQCPSCLTIFRVPVSALAQAQGRARCGVCKAEFDLLASLSEQLPAQIDAMLTRRMHGPLPLVTAVANKPGSAQSDLFSEVAQTRQPAPVFAKPALIKGVTKRTKSSLWIRANLLVFSLLIAQLAYATRTSWQDNRHLRPWLDAACAKLSCQLPLRRDIRQIALVARDVRPHPSVANALVVSATMFNQADFTQSYPVLEITLSNLDEQRIAMRRLSPQDYLADSSLLALGLPPGGTATIDLEVFDPGKQAVAFEFKFL